jgi:hypothetical protein
MTEEMIPDKVGTTNVGTGGTFTISYSLKKLVNVPSVPDFPAPMLLYAGARFGLDLFQYDSGIY